MIERKGGNQKMSFQTAHNQEFGQKKEQGTPIAKKLKNLFANANRLLPNAKDTFYRGNLKGGEKRIFAQQYNRLAKDWNYCRQAYSDVLTGIKDTHSLFGIQEKLQNIVAKLQSLMAKKYIPRPSENTTHALQAPQKDVRKYKPVYAGLAAITVASALLGACDSGTSAFQEPTPMVAEYTPEEVELENPTQETTGEEVLENTQDATLLPEEEVEGATQTPKEPLAIEFTDVENLSNEELNNLAENTSEFTEAVEAKVNQDPTLKAALFDSEGGLKVAFNPNNLFFHNGIWGYFAPEGGPLSNNLLIISNAAGSEGEIRFCSIKGANEILGLSLKETEHYLDFAMVSGQNVCLVRKSSDNSVMAINNEAGQWSLPANSGLNIAEIGQSAREIGRNAVAMATEEEVEETEEVELSEQEQIRADLEAVGINIDNLASSSNERIAKIAKINNNELQKWFDQSTKDNGTIVFIAYGFENPSSFDDAPTTEGGWRLLSFINVVYRKPDGELGVTKIVSKAFKDGKIFSLSLGQTGLGNGPEEALKNFYNQDPQNWSFNITKESFETNNAYYGEGSILIWNPVYPYFNNNGPNDIISFTNEELMNALNTGNLDLIYTNGILWPFEKIDAYNSFNSLDIE